MSTTRLVKEGSVMVEAFERLFPQFSNVHEANPLEGSALMGSVCNFAKCAFGAYNVPTVEGFDEHTSDANLIKHLNWDCLDDAMEGVLKIHLEKGEHWKNDNWWFHRRCDPYVVFRHNRTIVRSKTINNTTQPHWNSTHYLCLRKRHLEAKPDAVVTVSVYDDDSHGSILSVLDALDKDDHLGETAFDLEEVKCPGVHKKKLDFTKKSMFHWNTPTLHFTVEFIPLKTALSEMGKEKGTTNVWDKVNEGLTQQEVHWPELARLTHLGDIPLEAVAFVNVPRTGSQAWIHVDKEAKVVVVAFRGTDTSSLKDICTDKSCLPTELSPQAKSNRHFVLKASDVLRRSGIHLHRGFNAAYESIRESVLRILFDLTGWRPSWTICVTGHSLGAALATICAFETSNRKLSLESARARTIDASVRGDAEEWVTPQVAMVNYGGPRVGNAVFVDAYNETVVESLRVVNAGDPVHFLPPLYTHTKQEVLVHPNGSVDLSGEQLELEHLLDDAKRAIEDNQQEVQDSDVEDGESFLSVRVARHLQPYYFKIVERAVKSTFATDGRRTSK